MLKRISLVIAGLLIVSFAALSLLAGGPRNLYGLVRFALPHMSQGELRVGDTAPDVQIAVLDGRSTFHLHERIGQRPLVLIFGSYT